MYKSLSVLFFSLLMMAGVSGQKMGYINSQEIIAALPEVKQANSDIDVMKSMFQKKGEDMVKALQLKYQEFQKKQANGELAPVEADKQAAFIKEEEGKIAEFEKSSQQKIYEKSEELLKPIQDKVNKAIKDVATENGYLYIFDTSAGLLLYMDPAADATKLVKAKLGITQ